MAQHEFSQSAAGEALTLAELATFVELARMNGIPEDAKIRVSVKFGTAGYVKKISVAGY